MKFHIALLLLLFYTITFSQNFSVITHYSGCNSTGEIIIIANDTTKKYRYRMDSARCNLPKSPLQSSNVFSDLPPCYYEFTAIDEQGVEYKISGAKLGLKLREVGSIKCDTGTSHVKTFYAYNSNDDQMGVIGKNQPYQFPLQCRVRLNGSWIDSLTIVANDSIFDIPLRYYGIKDSIYTIEISDACGDTDMIIPTADLGFFGFKVYQNCDLSYILNITTLLTGDFPIGSSYYKWYVDSTLIGTGNKIVFDSIPVNKVVTVKMEWDGCSRTLVDDFSTIPIDTSRKKILFSLTSEKNVICKSQTTKLFVTRGSAISKISWSNGLKDVDTSMVDKAGIYTVYVENNLGCTDSATIQIKESKIQLDTFVVQNKCFAQNIALIDLSPSGGITPYRFMWNDSATSEDRINLSNGNYAVKIIDSAGCADSASFKITSPPPISLQLTAIAASCIVARDGSVSVSALGGLPPYQIKWNNGYTLWNVDTVPVGNYKITVSDQNNCGESFEFKIDDLSPLRGTKTDTLCAGSSIKVGTKSYAMTGRFVDTLKSIKGCDSIHISNLFVNPAVDFSLTSKDPTCNGLSDGSILISNINGFGPYKYSLNDRSIGLADLSKIAAGNHIIKVQDRFNCFKEKGIAVSNPEKIQFSVGKDTLIDFGDSIHIRPITNLDVSSIKSIEWKSVPSSWSCTNCLQGIKYRPTDDHILRAVLENLTGCKVEAEILIKINFDFKAFVPNVFMPASTAQSINQKITVMAGRQVRSIISFRIFNRFGDLVFQSQNSAPNDFSSGWDGRFKGQDAPQGVYAYFSEVEYIDGRKGIIKGDITLLR